MRKFLFGVILFLAMLFVPAVHAQTTLLVGGEGGINFNNKTIGVTAGIEQPFAKHFEIDLVGIFDPIESKTGYGSGFSYSTYGILTGWFAQHWGVNGQFDRAAYTVTQARKTAYYTYGGLSYRNIVGGLPARFDFDYFQQIHNGIAADGTETNHVQGGAVSFSVRLGCTNTFCVRLDETIDAGHVLNQGNPMCDGTFGNTGGPNGGPCKRQGTMSGGAQAAVVFEFSRRRGHEDDLF